MLKEQASGCGSGMTRTQTVELTQKGDTVTMVNIDRNWTTIGKIYNDIISFARIQRTSYGYSGEPGKVDIHATKIKISEDAETLTGEVNWSWTGDNGYNCNGISYLTYKRKSKE
jgi:hypothetical protein